MRIIIIGSGPTGIASAIALLSRGVEVMILESQSDTESYLTKERELYLSKPLDEVKKQLLQLEALQTISLPGHPQKTVLGNKLSTSVSEFSGENHGIQISASVGGLSKIWGATLLPLNFEKMNLGFATKKIDWYMREVLRTLSIPQTYPVPIEVKLNSIEKMPLAVFSEGKNDCLGLGICLSGCPRNAIWSADQALEILRNHPNFQILTDNNVLRVEETTEYVRILARTSDGREFDYEADKIFLAAGPISSHEILVRSGFSERGIDLLETPMTLIPFIRLGKNKAQSNGKALAANYLKFCNVKNGTSFIQLYEPNQFLASKSKYFANRIIRNKWIPKTLFNLVGVAMVYSESVDPKNLTINSKIGDNDGQLRTSISTLGSGRRIAINLKTRFLLLRGGYLLLLMLAKQTPPGSSIHYGGTYPMKANPANGEVDVLGCLKNHPRIHLVDSSIFPVIEPGPITLSLMTNAYRIGFEIQLED